MKRVNPNRWLVIVFLLLIPSQSFSWNYVCVDPGHGGIDDGCTGRIYGLKEKNVNLGVGVWLYTYLGYYYWWPIMTRYEDIDTDGPHRANINKKLVTFLKIIKLI